MVISTEPGITTDIHKGKTMVPHRKASKKKATKCNQCGAIRAFNMSMLANHAINQCPKATNKRTKPEQSLKASSNLNSCHLELYSVSAA